MLEDELCVGFGKGHRLKPSVMWARQSECGCSGEMSKGSCGAGGM